ncbi:MAG: alpha/beta fold hydrolase [Pseudomonadota bacterium]
MEKITFPGALGAPLAARLDRPDGPHRATALFAHCFSCSKDIAAARRIAARLAAIGIAVLRFDFTGLGHSGGEFANTTFTSNVGDLKAAAAWLEAQGMPPSVLIGHSLGGAAVLKAAGEIDSVKAVATIGAPFDPHHVTHQFSEALDKIEAEGEADVLLAGRPFRIGRDFVHDIAQAEMGRAIGAMNCALLVLHAPRDATVGIENASDIFTAAKHPKSFVTLDGADHLLTRPEDAEYAAEVIAAWSVRYIDLAPAPAPQTAPEGVVRSSEGDPEGFIQDISAGPSHALIADEPVAFGGTDRGPSPYGLVSAGLAACTAMTVRMYARRKGWPLDHIWVDVTHQKSHLTDADGADANAAKIDHFERTIHMVGELSDEQLGRLLEIADKCPVHRTLENVAHVRTQAVQPEAAS